MKAQTATVPELEGPDVFPQPDIVPGETWRGTARKEMTNDRLHDR
jgi:hypothetical protein